MKEKETELQAINRFVKVMHSKMVERRARYKPFGWRDSEYRTIPDLSKHLQDEIIEWRKSETIDEEMAELVDIANTAFMLWDRLRLEPTTTH